MISPGTPVSLLSQRSKWSVFTFRALRSVKRAAKRSQSPKVLDGCPKRILNKYERHTYKRSRSGHKKVTINKSHNFLGYFARRYWWWQSFDHMTSPNLIFDGGQVKVRTKRSSFQINIFYIKAHVYCSEFPQDSKYAFTFLLRRGELWKSQVKNNVIIFFYIWITKNFFEQSIGLVCGNCLLVQSHHKVI